MGGSFGKKTGPAALLLLVASIALAYGLRKDHYLLNKNVRLVFLRIVKYKEYSLHRGLTYRLQFNRDDYRLTVREPRPDPSWRVVAVHPYEGSVEPESPGLILTIHRGKVVQYQFEDKREILKPYVILYFHPRNKPSLRRGIMFNESGAWRAL
jgi:hypothetical protein